MNHEPKKIISSVEIEPEKKFFLLPCTPKKVPYINQRYRIYVNSLLVLQNFTTARKSGNIILTY